MLSIPRDMFVESEYLGVEKINSVYAKLRNRIGHDGAMEHLMEIVADITGKHCLLYTSDAADD